jgi:hypothetical protein
MFVTELFDSMPLWGTFLITLLTIFLSMDFGFRMGKRRKAKISADETIRTGPVAAASFSLLAFMLAITFGIVDARLKELKHVALDEANAIDTAFVRADLLPAADRVEVRKLLQDYVDLRVEAEQQDDEEIIAEMKDRLDELQSDLWSNAVVVGGQKPTGRLFVQSVNKLFEMDRKWITLSIYYRLPGIIWTVLYGLAILAMMMGGYDSGASDSRRAMAASMVAALGFSVVLVLLIALDRPSPDVTQSVMINLQEDIRSSMRSGS